MALELNVERRKSNFEITLNSAVTELNEVVVVGFSPNVKPDPNPSTDSTVTDQSKKDFMIIEQNPQFAGEMNDLYKYMGQHIHYPVEAMKAGTQGRIFISFTINKNGDVRNPHVVQGLGFGTDDEVLRVILGMPRWKPAIQMGQTVSVHYKMPIHFNLEYNTPKPSIEKK